MNGLGNLLLLAIFISIFIRVTGLEQTLLLDKSGICFYVLPLAFEVIVFMFHIQTPVIA